METKKSEVNSKSPTEIDAETEATLKKMEEFYDKKLPFLRKKHEFDILNAEIDEARIRSLAAKDQFTRFILQQADKQKAESDQKGTS